MTWPKWEPCKFFMQLLLASVCMSLGWGALLWYVAAPIVGVLVGVVMFLVIFVAFWSAEQSALRDLDEIYNRRFDD